jgi:hypothetical protein
METIRVNIRTAVNAKAIRREQYNGREHIVVPSYTLPDNVVMNGGMYPKDEIDASYAGLEDTPAPLGHPMVEGQYVSARSPAAINAFHVGAFNRNVKRDGHRVSIEKWLDVEYAKNSEGGRAVLDAIDTGKPFLDTDPIAFALYVAVKRANVEGVNGGRRPGADILPLNHRMTERRGRVFKAGVGCVNLILWIHSAIHNHVIRQRIRRNHDMLATVVLFTPDSLSVYGCADVYADCFHEYAPRYR